MRGQVSIYIILGIMVLAILLFVVFATRQGSPEVAVRDINEVDYFVSSTLERATERCLLVLGAQGGWYQPKEFLKSGAARIGFAWQGNDTLIKAEGLSEELVGCIEAHLSACLSFESFRGRGFSIENGAADASVLLGASDVGSSLRMPVSVRLAEQQLRLDEFAAQHIPVRVAHLHTIAGNITALRSLQQEPRDFDLSNLASIDVNATIYEMGSEQVYVLTDAKSHVEGKQYEFAFANSFGK